MNSKKIKEETGFRCVIWSHFLPWTSHLHQLQGKKKTRQIQKKCINHTGPTGKQTRSSSRQKGCTDMFREWFIATLPSSQEIQGTPSETYLQPGSLGVTSHASFSVIVGQWTLCEKLPSSVLWPWQAEVACQMNTVSVILSKVMRLSYASLTA